MVMMMWHNLLLLLITMLTMVYLGHGLPNITTTNDSFRGNWRLLLFFLICFRSMAMLWHNPLLLFMTILMMAKLGHGLPNITTTSNSLQRNGCRLLLFPIFFRAMTLCWHNLLLLLMTILAMVDLGHGLPNITTTSNNLQKNGRRLLLFPICFRAMVLCWHNLLLLLMTMLTMVDLGHGLPNITTTSNSLHRKGRLFLLFPT
jgi:hypothetical protein